MLEVNVGTPLITVGIASPLHEEIGFAGVPSGAIATLNCGYDLLIGTDSASIPFKDPGERFTPAVAVPKYGTVALIVSLPPIPVLLRLLPPSQVVPPWQSSKKYLAMTSLIGDVASL